MLLSLSLRMTAQTVPTLHLSDYVGTYSDDAGKTLEIVAGDELFAVQDDAKYRLKSAGPDEFAPVYGARIPFLRFSSGGVAVIRHLTEDAGA